MLDRTAAVHRRLAGGRRLQAGERDAGAPVASRTPTCRRCLDAVVMRALAKNPANRYQTRRRVPRGPGARAAGAGGAGDAAACRPGGDATQVISRPQATAILPPQESPPGSGRKVWLGVLIGHHRRSPSSRAPATSWRRACSATRTTPRRRSACPTVIGFTQDDADAGAGERRPEGRREVRGRAPRRSRDAWSTRTRWRARPWSTRRHRHHLRGEGAAHGRRARRSRASRSPRRRRWRRQPPGAAADATGGERHGAGRQHHQPGPAAGRRGAGRAARWRSSCRLAPATVTARLTSPACRSGPRRPRSSDQGLVAVLGGTAPLLPNARTRTASRARIRRPEPPSRSGAP